MKRRIGWAVFSLGLMMAPEAHGQRVGPGPGAPLGSLKSVPVPQIPGVDRYVRDQAALVVLGKALFWDIQAGSDGKTACATCHFHGGADHRIQNQLASPALVPASVPLNRTLEFSDFPFYRLADPNNNRSGAVQDLRQVAGSAGVVHRTFLGTSVENSLDGGADVGGSFFSIAGINLRQVTSRNAPSVINAVFNVRNFWDGRASTVFTGATPFGDSDSAANVYAWRNGELTPERVRLENASLASQAVGPPLNEIEMSYAGRTWPQLGAKMLAVAPLARQAVSPEDSVLGPFANPDGKGLAPEFSYLRLIEAAFHPEYTYTVETNFGLIWGLAIQAYESTLVSNESRYDQFAEGNRNALTPLEQAGLQEFQSTGASCTRCHAGPEFTVAAYTNAARRGANPADPNDIGFFRIGVTRIGDDAGLGGVDGFGLPLINTPQPGAASGTFKAPSLRNVELTGPYFHDGGQATLEQVLDFYGRQGNFPQGPNLGPLIGQIRLNPQEKIAVVAFLKSLTDERVRYQRAPFDHPEICVPVGHAESAPGVPAVDTGSFTSAADKWALIPVTGRNGSSVPLQTFDELLRGVGNDGTRANTLTQACTP